MKFLSTLSRHLPLLSLFIRFFFFGGVLKANGVLLSYTVEQLHSNNAAVAWAYTIQCAVAYLAAPLGTYMLQFFSVRQLGILGGFLTGLGYVCSGIYLDSVWQLYIYQAISGLGFSMWTLPQCMYIQANFERLYSSVFAVGAGFIFVGVAVLPLTLQWLIREYGQAGGKLCFGALLWNCILGGVLLRPTSKSRRLLKDYSYDHIDESEKHFIDRYSLCFSSMIRHPKYTVLVAFVLVQTYVYSSWAIYLVTFGEARGLSRQKAVYLSTVAGVGGMVGSGIGHILFHLQRMNVYTGCLLPSIVTGVTLGCSILSKDFLILSVLNFWTGLSLGLQYAGWLGMIPILVCNFHLAAAYSSSSVTEGFVYQLGGLSSGLIQDYYGSPEMVFAVCSLVSMLVTPISLVWIFDQPAIRQCYDNGDERR